MRRKIARASRRSLPAVAVAIAIGLGVWVILIWRAQTTTLTAYRLCVVFAEVIVASDHQLGRPHTPGYQYYLMHPDELRAAHHANQVLIHELPCKAPPALTSAHLVGRA